MSTVKDAVTANIESVMAIRQIIEQGLADSMAGRTQNVKDVRKEYDLPGCH